MKKILNTDLGICFENLKTALLVLESVEEDRAGLLDLILFDVGGWELFVLVFMSFISNLSLFGANLGWFDRN